MPYEAMQMLQFLFSLVLVVAAFGAGVFAGWYRWAPKRPRSGEPDQVDDADQLIDLTSSGHAAPPPRPSLFSAQVVGRAAPMPPEPPELEPGWPRTVVVGSDEAIPRRELGPPVRGALGSGGDADDGSPAPEPPDASRPHDRAGGGR